MPPGHASRKQRRRISRGDSICIGARTRVKTRREARRRMPHLARGDIARKQRHKCTHPTRTRDLELLCRRGKAHVLAYGMHSGIGSTGTGQLDRTAQEDLDRTTNLACDSSLTGLLGKPAIVRAIVAQLQDDSPVQDLGSIKRLRISIHHDAPFQMSSQHATALISTMAHVTTIPAIKRIQSRRRRPRAGISMEAPSA